MEFKIFNPTENEIVKKIDFNFDEMKFEIETSVEKYKNLVITEDTIKEGKADRAKLNKFREAIESKRKEVKKQWLQPYNDFEAKVKELVALIDEPLMQIDTALKGFEEQRKDEKLKDLREYFNTEISKRDREVAEFVNFDEFMQGRDRLLNASVTLKNAQKEVELFLSSVLEHLCILKAQANSMNIDYLALKLEYKKSGFDLQKAIEYSSALNTTKKEQEELTATEPEQPSIFDEPKRRINFWVEVNSTDAKKNTKVFQRKQYNLRCNSIVEGIYKTCRL